MKNDDTLDLATETSDDTFFINGKEKNITDALESVDGLLSAIQETDNFTLGADALRSMYAAGRAVGWSMAYLTYGMRKLWLDSGKEDESFWYWMQDVTPLRRITLERYIHSWEAYLKFDDERLLQRPIKDAITLGAAVAQGYEVTEKDLDRLINAENSNSFANELRGIKGQEARKSALTIYVEPDGTLNAWTKEGVFNIGYISRNDETPTVQKAVERIIRSAGLIKR